MPNKLLIAVAETLDKTRLLNPIIHHITNYVTANDCANVTLAVGASPIMADDELEINDITALSQALVINIGTLNQQSTKAIFLAGKQANSLGIPIILDPVGAGISNFRNQTLEKLLQIVEITVIRGNLSEISYLAGYHTQPKGVDVASNNQFSQLESQELAKLLAKRYQTIVAITGKIDIISDGKHTFLVKNGVADLQKITGTGCMLTSLIASFCASTPNQPLVATLTALLTMGICGELAVEKNKEQGSSSLKNKLIDSLNTLTHQTVRERAIFEQTTD